MPAELASDPPADDEPRLVIDIRNPAADPDTPSHLMPMRYNFKPQKAITAAAAVEQLDLHTGEVLAEYPSQVSSCPARASSLLPANLRFG